MDVQTVINTAWNKAEGQPFGGVVGDINWNNMLSYVQDYLRQYVSQPGVDWTRFYQSGYSLGTITATNSFDYDNTEVRKFSQENRDPVQILHTDGINYTNYTIVPPEQLWEFRYRNVCAVVGQTLQFPNTFATTDAEYGGTLYAPIYGFPDNWPTIVSNATNICPIDDPNWLVCMVAYQKALTDILRKDIAPTFENEAEPFMQAMITANEAQKNAMATPWEPFSGYQEFTYLYGYGGGLWL